jgi:hypothetical protein
MADKKISDLTSSGAIGGTEELPIVQSGSTVKTTINAIKTFFLSSLGLSDVLSINNSTGNTSIDSPNGNNKLIVTDVEAALIYNGTNEGSLNISELKSHVKHSSRIDLEAPEVRVSSLTTSQIVETDSSNNLISAAKNSAYNLNLGTTAGTVLEGNRISQTITSGVTNKAPSEDAVFDALALKRSTTTEMFLGMAAFSSINLADATTYYFGDLQNLPANATANRYLFKFPNNYTITKILITLYNNASASSESVSFYLRENNTTDKTITTSLNMNTISTNSSKIFEYTGLSLSVTSSTNYEIKIVCPTWVTNPTSVNCVVNFYGY